MSQQSNATANRNKYTNLHRISCRCVIWADSAFPVSMSGNWAECTLIERNIERSVTLCSDDGCKPEHWLCVHTAGGESVKIRPGRPASNAVERFVTARPLWRRSYACLVFKGAAKQTSLLILCTVNLMKYFKCESEKLIDGNNFIVVTCLLTK